MTETERKPYIEFKDVYKAFGSHRVLHHVNFDVYPGETVASSGAAASANRFRCTTSWDF